MKIRQSLLVTNGVFIFILLLFVSASAYWTHLVEKAYLQESNQTVPIIKSLENLRFATVRIEASVHEVGVLAQLRGDIQNESAFIDEGESLFRSSFATYADLIERFLPERTARRETISRQWEDFIKTGRELETILRPFLPGKPFQAAPEET
jgi:hypothetical protein